MGLDPSMPRFKEQDLSPDAGTEPEDVQFIQLKKLEQDLLSFRLEGRADSKLFCTLTSLLLVSQSKSQQSLVSIMT